VPLPLSSPLVLGLCPHRRDLVPVIALGANPSAEATGEPGRPVILILRSEQGTWGIRLDRGGVVVAEGHLDDRRGSQGEPEGAVVIGTITRGETSYGVIDAEATWRSLRDAIERWYKSDRSPELRSGA
jgi:purine-binding chemotaxis protein CheW